MWCNIVYGCSSGSETSPQRPTEKNIYIYKVKRHQNIKEDLGKQRSCVWAPRMQHIQIGFYGDETEEKRVSRGKSALASAEEGEVAFPAAHLAAHVGHYVVEVPSGQVGAQAAAAAQALQTVLLSCWHDKTQQMIQFSVSF